MLKFNNVHVNSVLCSSQLGTMRDTRFFNQCHLKVMRTCLSLVLKIELLWMLMKVKINYSLDSEMNQQLKNQVSQQLMLNQQD